jgi:hypothetical protein
LVVHPSPRLSSLQPGDPVARLLLEARDAGITVGDSGCPSGDSDRRLTNPRFSLQPRRPNKSPRVSISRKQNANPEPNSLLKQYSPVVLKQKSQFFAESLSYIISKQQHVIPLCVGGGGLPLTNNNPYQQQNLTTPYVFVFIIIVLFQNIVTVHCIQKINDTFC